MRRGDTGPLVSRGVRRRELRARTRPAASPAGARFSLPSRPSTRAGLAMVREDHRNLVSPLLRGRISVMRVDVGGQDLFYGDRPDAEVFQCQRVPFNHIVSFHQLYLIAGQ